MVVVKQQEKGLKERKNGLWERRDTGFSSEINKASCYWGQRTKSYQIFCSVGLLVGGVFWLIFFCFFFLFFWKGGEGKWEFEVVWVFFTAAFVVKFPAICLTSMQPEHSEMYKELICAWTGPAKAASVAEKCKCFPLVPQQISVKIRNRIQILPLCSSAQFPRSSCLLPYPCSVQPRLTRQAPLQQSTDSCREV